MNSVFTTDNQSALEQSFFKGRIVCVINLLALFAENKDIIDVTESSLSINFDQTMMGIYSDFFVSGVIPITFE
jgi:hypothetical protein